MTTFGEWAALAGDGTMDERSGRLAPTLRKLMGLEQPPCLLCGETVVLVDSDDYEPPRWVDVRFRRSRCYPEASSSVEAHRVPPL